MSDTAAQAAALFGWMDEGKTAPDAPAPTKPPAERSQAERLYGTPKQEPYEDVFEKAIREEKERNQPQPKTITQTEENVAIDLTAMLAEQGMEPDAQSDALTAFLKENNLGMEHAEALTKLHREHYQQVNTRQFEQWHEASLKEFRGVDLSDAKRMLVDHGDEELLELLDSTGAGSHPAVVRFLKRLADAW